MNLLFLLLATFIMVGCQNTESRSSEDIEQVGTASDPAGAASSKVPESPVDLAPLFAKPLIIGASVSANFSTPSPGRRLALRYTTEGELITIAQSKRLGRQSVKKVTSKTLAGRTIVIGVDMFFWDSTLPNPRESLNALRKFLELTASLNIPVALGDVPQLLPGKQPSRDAVNLEIYSMCTPNTHCFIIPYDQMLKDVRAVGYLEVKDKRYTLKQLIPDGLHLSDVASEYLADQLAGELQRGHP
jgi:hypothetical protein